MNSLFGRFRQDIGRSLSSNRFGGITGYVKYMYFDLFLISSFTNLLFLYFHHRRRAFGAGGGSGEPHVPEGYDKLGKIMLVSCYLWIFYRMKEDKGQLFGLYKPWEHPHEHSHVQYEKSGTGPPMPVEVEYEEVEDED